ncbi:ABC transporter permease [Ruminococcus gauvreauii]|uniref:ABC transporter permease n=1 Tax=Ruminococcus gauvreauii TaxID=438033 RepID=A0ABY5VII4_9FIRM|nr:ABC transporter permease [Ruminococcus gauvreauii]UWP60041.1 ABC transporter permease [Ruminococcus gauvreauii]
MNIFNKAALQSMKKSRTRTIVTVIGVVLSAAMITAVATFGVSLLNYAARGAIIKYGDWHVGFLDVDSSFVHDRAADKGVSNTASYENIGYTVLEGGKNPDKPYLFIAGFSEEAFVTLPINLLSGRLPENSGELLVSGSVAANGGVKYAVGDTLTLAVGDRMNGNRILGQHTPYMSGNASGDDKETFVPDSEKTYTVVGICQRPAFEEYSAPGYTVITKADPADTADSYSVFVTLSNPRRVRDYADSTAGTGSYILNDNVLRFMGLSDDNIFNMLLYTVGGIVTAIIMIGSVFLIYNAFTISLNERTHQFGILSSVGATAKQLRSSVLFEGLCIGAVGIPIGILTGIASMKLVISIVAGNFGSLMYSEVPLTLTVSFPAIAAAAAVSMVTILISAYIPARKAANTPVMESIRQTNEVKIQGGDVKTSKFVQRFFGLEGTLALKNFKRNKKRYRSIVLSLVLSVVLFVSGNSFGTTLKEASKQANVATTYDIALATPKLKDDEMLHLYDRLKTADGVYESSYQADLTYSCEVKASDFSEEYLACMELPATDEPVPLSMDFQFLDDSTYMDIIKGLDLPQEEYFGENANIIAVAAVQNMKDGQSEETDEITGLFRSPSMNFTVSPETDGGKATEYRQNISVTFVKTVPPDIIPDPSRTSADSPYFLMVMAPYSLMEKLVPDDACVNMKGMTFKSRKPARTVAEMENLIQGESITADYTLYNVSKMLEENRSMIFIANVFTYVFVIMISLIAIANVFNTISTNIKLRRRELAMLRSVGMSERDFQKMMNFECAFYGMRALLFGLPIAAVCSWLIFKGMFMGGAEIHYIFPWSSLLISAFSVFFVVFITMLYAVSRIKKENIIDALRDDMT